MIAFKIIFFHFGIFFVFSCSYHCHHALYRNTWQKENHGSTILFNCSVLLSPFHLFRKVRHRISSFLPTIATALVNDIQNKSTVTRIIIDDRLSWMKQRKKNSYRVRRKWKDEVALRASCYLRLLARPEIKLFIKNDQIYIHLHTSNDTSMISRKSHDLIYGRN